MSSKPEKCQNCNRSLSKGDESIADGYLICPFCGTSHKIKEPFDIRCARICMCEECVVIVDTWEETQEVLKWEKSPDNCSLFGARALVQRLHDRAGMNFRNGNNERALAYLTAIADAEELLG